jgi:hypothetical protein
MLNRSKSDCSNSNTNVVEILDSKSVQQFAPAMVPVGLNSPSNWMGSLSVKGYATWGAPDQASMIQPGRSVQGFEITSRGLPSIRAFDAEPYLDIAALPISAPSGPDDLNRYDKDLAAIKDNVNAKGMTVAPTPPPTNFNAPTFLKIIQQYREQARNLGWITDERLSEDLAAKLSQAQEALKNNESGQAKNVLESMIAQLNADQKGHLRPEAIALLKFNAQYLLSKIH